MVLTCCVKGCKSESYKGSGVSFHRFPKDEEIKKRWLDVISRDITQHSAVCSLHFKSDSFATHPAAARKLLKVNAVPSIYPVESDTEISRMGSKTPGNKGDHECEVCNSKFLTVQALRSHQSARHPTEARKRESSPGSRQKATPKNTPIVQSSRVSKRLQLKKGGNLDTEESENSEDQNMGEETNKIEFVCPICPKVYPIYFQAFKHVQKKHSVDKHGKSVSPDSTDIITPTRVETCLKCKQRFTTTHVCGVPIDKTNVFLCLKCDEELPNVWSFNRHVSFKHFGHVDSMFFKNYEEFSLWKQRMETQVRMKYMSLHNSFTPKYYQCNYVSPKNEFNKTYLCPSLIQVKELTSGIQIHYNKQHSGHECPEYELPEEFLQYLTNIKKEDTTEYDEKKEFTNLYEKFRELLKIICIEAENISLTHLKKLFGPTLRMQALLNSFDEVQRYRDPLISSNMTDDQITDALEGKRTSARLKRKSETKESFDGKKRKVETNSEDDYDNAQSKNKGNGNNTISKENKVFESPKIRPVSSLALLSPSFNDSYKQFIGTNESNQSSTKKSSKPKQKEIVKTKMGQFSPKKKPTNTEETNVKIKTKPNVLKPMKTNSRFNYAKDIKYEVREQENDCNILILKI